MTRFPAWTPRELIEQIPWHKRRAAEQSEDERFAMQRFGTANENLELLQKLATDARMESVWRLLDRRVAKLTTPLVGKDHYSVQLLLACGAAIAQWRMRPKVTLADARDLHLEIAKRADQLVKLLRSEYGHFHTHWGLYPRQFERLGRELGVKTLDGNMGKYFAGPGNFPPLDVFLQTLQLNALKFARNPPLADAQPNAPDAPVRFAAIWLVDRYFKVYFGQPLYDIAARVTNVIIGSDIDEDHVRAWARTRKARRKLKEGSRRTDG